MKMWAAFQKTFRENIREWKILILTLVFGPFFVYIMYAYFSASTPSYTLLILNRDQPARTDAGAILRVGDDLCRKWAEAAYPDGRRIFKVQSLEHLEDGERLLKNREADLLMVVPPDLSRSIETYRRRPGSRLSPLKTMGDPSSVRFAVAASFADYLSYSAIASAAGIELAQVVEFQGIGSGGSPRDFDQYVPALLVLAIIMVLFTAAASMIKEVDKGTIIRLNLSRLSAFDFLAAVSLNQVLIGTLALLLTYLSALSVGYRSSGSMALFLFVGGMATLSVIALSILVAALLRTIFELLTVGVFPFFILVFFSESMFPLPRITLLRLAGHPFYVNDVLPTALAVKAFNKILNFNAGFGEIGFEMAGIMVLTIIDFVLGLWLFYRRHLRVR